ncbi:iron-containing alcohol dehydrogenase family protein [Wukongibacter baidiensis]|uniref:iron-containing alcohol dehydrogenase family protein n=1 Tax=Wukongibacter baidiensis TaxID=1723361 RepID=UPI003D7FEF80
MSKLTVTFPNYTIGEDSLQDLVDICLHYGRRALIVGGKTALEKAKPKIESALEGSALEVVDFMWYGGECTFENMGLVAKKGSDEKVDMIIGVGGGKAIDTAKGAADKINVPVFTVPTIAATCAATTCLSVVYNEKGEFDSFYFFEKPPVHIFMDSEIIAEAPVKYLWAGIGDTIAKHYECTLASRGDKLDHSSGMGREISAMCVKPMFQYGEKALQDCEKGESSFEISQVILNNVLSTGLVSMLVEEKYNGALAHSLFYGLTILEHIEKNHLHGEVVAYGVLVQLAMDNQEEELKKLHDFYKKIKLPTCLEDIEVKNDRAYLEQVLENTVNSPDMEYLPYEVTKDMVFEGIQKLEKLNS